MTLSPLQTLLILGAVMLGTVIPRFLPFILFANGRKRPAVIDYLGKVLPFAAMGLLVVYCLKGVSPFVYPYGIPEALAIGAIVLTRALKNNVLLNIGAGTVVYILLVQFVFR